jgi:transcriptional regulator with XRE-family HTH domain
MTLEAARVNAGLTQKQVCDAIDISLTTIGLWEHGDRMPTVDKAIKLAELYCVPLDCINFARKVETN